MADTERELRARLERRVIRVELASMVREVRRVWFRKVRRGDFVFSYE